LHSSASIPGFVVHFAGSAVAHSPASHALLSGGIAVLMVMMPPAALSLKLLCIAGTTLRIRDVQRQTNTLCLSRYFFVVRHG